MLQFHINLKIRRKRNKGGGGGGGGGGEGVLQRKFFTRNGEKTS